jgi:hypothetical protein
MRVCKQIGTTSSLLLNVSIRNVFRLVYRDSEYNSHSRKPHKDIWSVMYNRIKYPFFYILFSALSDFSPSDYSYSYLYKITQIESNPVLKHNTNTFRDETLYSS